MPFTAAHPMAVLPVLRWRRALRLDATCLVIGSMAPDFEYFVRLRPFMTISHTVPGLWQWSLPVTLILAAVLHGLVKWPLLLVAPVGVARRAAGIVAAPWRPWRPPGGLASVAAVASCAVSAVLGAITHLVWDSFTHANRWATFRFPVLTEQLRLPVLGTFAVHRVLQYASTLVGMAVLAAVIVRRLRREPAVTLPAQPRVWPRACLAGCVALGVAAAVARVVAWRGAEIGEVVVGTISGALAGTIVASAILFGAGRRFHRAVRPIVTA